MIAGYLILFAFVWAVCSVYYQAVVRPFARDAARFDLFAIRDELRSMAIKGEVDQNTYAFGHLESMLNNMVHLCKWYNVGTVIEFVAMKRDQIAYPLVEKFDEEAPESLKKLEHQAMRCMLTVMVANSPVWMFSCGAVAVVGLLWKRQKTAWVERENRVIWHSDSELSLA